MFKDLDLNEDVYFGNPLSKNNKDKENKNDDLDSDYDEDMGLGKS